MSILKAVYYSDKVVDIETFIGQYLDGNDYGRGSVETSMAQAKNTTEALARLCSILHSKDILTEKDIFFIGTGYKYETK